jgi:DNA mismatch endonuclease (patch repair protein)
MLFLFDEFCNHNDRYDPGNAAMADTVDKATRSRMMAGIRGKDTKPEMAIRSALHSAGFRYRLHVAGLPGRPDVVFPKYRAVIFVHGCFWHRHPDCWWTTTPSSNALFWAEKFDQNVARDNRNIACLKKMGWRVAIVWECTLRAQSQEKVVVAIEQWLISNRRSLILPKRAKLRNSPPE